MLQHTDKDEADCFVVPRHRPHEYVHEAAREQLHMKYINLAQRARAAEQPAGQRYRCGRVQLLPSHESQLMAVLLVVSTEASAYCSKGAAIGALTGDLGGE